MPLSAPSTFTDGTFPAAAAMNTLSAAMENLCQVALGKPTATGLGCQPFCKLYLTSTMSVPNAAVTQISWAAAYANTDGMWNTSYSTIVIITHPGWYRVTAQAAWDTGAVSTERRLQITVNNGISYAGSTNATISSSVAINRRMQTTAMVKLNTGDALSAVVYQSSGAALNLLAASATSTSPTWGTWLMVIYEAPYV